LFSLKEKIENFFDFAKGGKISAGSPATSRITFSDAGTNKVKIIVTSPSAQNEITALVFDSKTARRVESFVEEKVA
jgi:hypothetical protein